MGHGEATHCPSHAKKCSFAETRTRIETCMRQWQRLILPLNHKRIGAPTNLQMLHWKRGTVKKHDSFAETRTRIETCVRQQQMATSHSTLEPQTNRR